MDWLPELVRALSAVPIAYVVAFVSLAGIGLAGYALHIVRATIRGRE